MADLRTDYKDDILDTSVNTQRKYRMVNNEDGTISLVDETVYTQKGDSFGAAEVNQIHSAVNLVNNNLNMRYNPDDDYIYILIDGEWKKSPYKGYMQYLNLIINGAVQDDWSLAFTNKSYTMSATTQDGYVLCQGTTADQQNMLVFNIPINTTNYSKLYIEVAGNDITGNIDGRFGVASVNTYTSYTSLSNYITPTSSYATYTLNVADYDTIYIYVYCYASRQMLIKNLYLQ